MSSFQKAWAPIASILGIVLLAFQLVEAFTGNRTLFTGLLILVSLIAIGASMWKFAFTPSVVPPFPKYRFHWVAKIIIFLDVVSVLISGLFILTILNVIPDYYGFMMVETSTSTPTITPTLISNTPQHPRPISTIDPCGRFVSRIYKGEKVRSANILDENLNIRRSPSLSAEIITYVKNGTEFQILDGPVCADNLMWWEASTKNGSIKGWVAEVNSFGIYYLEP